MSRPSTSGWSIKQLGVNEYQRLYQRAHRPRKTSRRRWTGLSRKHTSGAEYQAGYRALIRANPCNPCL